MSASNGNAMSDDQVKSMEQQFDDLLDLGGFTSSTEVTTSTTTTTKTTTNGDLLGDFEPIEAPGSPTGDVVSVTRELEDGTTIVETTTTTTAESEEYVDLDIVNGTDNSQEGALDTSESKIPEAEKHMEELKAVDFMKARYQGQQPKSRTKIIREPKKLEHSFLKQGEEGEEGAFLKTGKFPEHKEGTAELKLLSGIDYSKSKYESLVKEPVGPLSPTDSVPVNRKPVEKVAPPEITQNLRALFESGDLPDKHKVKKMDIDTKDAPDSGVYENKPAKRPDLVRSSDEKQKCEFEAGRIKNISSMWGKQEETVKKKGPIKLVEEGTGPAVLESQPTVRDDVVHASAVGEKDHTQIESGRAKALRESFLKSQEDKPREKKQIKLYEDGEGASPAVLESEPAVRDDLVHASSVQEKDFTNIESGKARALRESFLKSQEDKPKERKQIKLFEDGEAASPAVLESEPELREDLVRSSAIQEKDLESIESGRAKALRESFLKSQEEKPKERKQIKLYEEGDASPAVLESQPVVRDDLVQSSAVQEKDFTKIESGRARALRESFLKAQEDKPKEKKQIKLYEEGDATPAVVESQPAQAAEGVVRAADEAPEDATFVRGNIASKTGFFAQAATRTSDTGSRKPINIREGAEEEAVRESEPKVLEGVVRSSDRNSELSVERGKARNLKGMFQNLTEQQETYRGEKKPVQLDIDSGPAVIENEPRVNPDVVRSGEMSSDVLFSKRGHARNTARQFLTQQDTPRGPKQPIQLDIADGPAVIENVPAAGDENVVRSSYEPAVKQVERGNVHGAMSFLQRKQEEESKVKTSAEKQAEWLQEIEAGKATQEAMFALHDQERKARNAETKPQWKLELEAAQAAQAAAAQEEEEERREAREQEYKADEQLEMLKGKKAKNLKAMFQQLEKEAQEEPSREPPRQAFRYLKLVRFTPPREVTPERQMFYKEAERNKPKEAPLPDYVPPPDVPITSSTTLVFSQGQTRH